jgi:hypothetical protein
MKKLLLTAVALATLLAGRAASACDGEETVSNPQKKPVVAAKKTTKADKAQRKLAPAPQKAGTLASNEAKR